MKQIFFAILLTLFLGPGFGHIYLKSYKKGIILILCSLLFALYIAWKIMTFVTDNTINLSEFENKRMLFQEFYILYPKTTFIYDILLAAVWAYAFVDVYYIGKNKLRSK